MSKFVNFKKRDINLPLGCKDLADVLKRKAPPQDIPQPVASHSSVGSLSEIQKYAAMVCESKARVVSLFIHAREGNPSVAIVNSEDGMRCLSTEVEMGAREDKAARKFIEKHGFDMVEVRQISHPSAPEIPLRLGLLVKPLPLETSALTRLLTELFRDVFEFPAESELQFFFEEYADTP